MTDPRDEYVEEGGDGTDPELPEEATKPPRPRVERDDGEEEEQE